VPPQLYPGGREYLMLFWKFENHFSLQENKSLQNLNIQLNGIGPKGAVALAEALKVSACPYPVLSFLRHFTSATALPRWQGVLDDFSFGSSNISVFV
jgi:hypothetical protein